MRELGWKQKSLVACGIGSLVACFLVAAVLVRTSTPIPVAPILFFGLVIATSLFLFGPGGKWSGLKITVVVISFLPVFWFYLIVSCEVANSLRLDNFGKQLLRYPLPEGAVLREHSFDIGVLQGNGNHCDFKATLVLESSLSERELREHFRGFTPQPAIAGSELEFLQFDISELSTSIGTGLFRVQLLDPGHSRYFDLHCT